MISTSMRRIYLPLGLNILVFGTLLISGCMGTSNVTQESPSLAGQRYRTKVDLYLFSNLSGKHLYLGKNDPKLVGGARTLPEVVSSENVGKTFAGDTVLDVVPAGAELTSRSVFRDSSGQGVIVFFICSLQYSGKHANSVDTFFIQSSISGHNGQLPMIHPAIADRIELPRYEPAR